VSGIDIQPVAALADTGSPATQAPPTLGLILLVVLVAGLIASVGGGFLAWMLLAVQSLLSPAGAGVMPSAAVANSFV
jgi:arginine:ornithine antiporter/lysine permease